jgi:hypothetical protein
LNRVPLTLGDHGEEWALPGDIRRLKMRELSTNELGTVIGGSVSYPGVYLQELSGNLISIPGVSTSTGQQTYVAYQAKTPFHHKVLSL